MLYLDFHACARTNQGLVRFCAEVAVVRVVLSGGQWPSLQSASGLLERYLRAEGRRGVALVSIKRPVTPNCISVITVCSSTACVGPSNQTVMGHLSAQSARRKCQTHLLTRPMKCPLIHSSSMMTVQTPSSGKSHEPCKHTLKSSSSAYLFPT